jgi:hypothetical protein
VSRHSRRAVADRKQVKDNLRPQIRNTVFLGIVYGLIDTLPMVLVILMFVFAFLFSVVIESLFVSFAAAVFEV